MSRYFSSAVMNPLLVELLRNGVILCTNCWDNHLTLSEQLLNCPQCGEQWPVHNDVPDMFNRYTTSSGAKGEEDFSELADAIAQVLVLEEKNYSEKVLEITERASRYSCIDAEITAEINELRSRFIPQCPPVFPAIPTDANKSPELEMERHYFPRRVVSGETIIANVRIKNCGQFSWSSRADHGLKFSISWIDENNQRVPDLLVPINFPIGINSGRSITLPVTIQASRKPGVYRVHACVLDWQLGIATEARSGIEIQVDSLMYPQITSI